MAADRSKSAASEMDTSPTCAAELGGLEHAETVRMTTDTPIRAPTTRPENTHVTFHVGGRRQIPTRHDGPAQTATHHHTIRTSTRSGRTIRAHDQGARSGRTIRAHDQGEHTTGRAYRGRAQDRDGH